MQKENLILEKQLFNYQVMMSKGGAGVTRHSSSNGLEMRGPGDNSFGLLAGSAAVSAVKEQQQQQVRSSSASRVRSATPDSRKGGVMTSHQRDRSRDRRRQLPSMPAAPPAAAAHASAFDAHQSYASAYTSPPPERSSKHAHKNRKDRRPSTYSDDVTNTYANEPYAASSNQYADEYSADYQYFSDKYSNAEYPTTQAPSGGKHYNQQQSQYADTYQQASGDPYAHQNYGAYNNTSGAYADGQYAAYTHAQDTSAAAYTGEQQYTRKGSDSELRRQRRP